MDRNSVVLGLREQARQAVTNFNQRKFNRFAFTNEFGVNVAKIEIGDSILLQETSTEQKWFRVTYVKIGADYQSSSFGFTGGKAGGCHVLAIEKAQKFAAAA